MKKSKVFVIVFSLLLAIGSHFVTAQTVYVTETGKKYHKKNCTIAKEGKKGLELAAAKKQGFEACKVCYVEPTSTAKKQEAVDPKKKK